MMPNRKSAKSLMGLAQFCLIVSSAFAHQDVIIELGRDGSLSGLPAKYQPSRLDLPKNDANVTVEIGKAVIQLPGCISELFRRIPRRHVKLTASWYHDPTNLPYYLNIELQEQHSKEGYFDGWSLLINLDTAQLMSLERVWQTDHGWGQQGVKIAPTQICTPDELKQLTPIETK